MRRAETARHARRPHRPGPAPPRPRRAGAGPGHADDPWTACRRAILAAEPRSGLPPGLLLAIALVESGRSDPRTGRFEPWPWSLNVEGEGRAPPTLAAAAAEVAALQAAGRRSIDIGCMQVNLLHHPDAFPDVPTGLRPEVNIRYAIGFLKSLHAPLRQLGGGHRQLPFRRMRSAAANYHRRVVLARLGAAWGAGGGTVPIAAAAGLCAPGLRPVLKIRPRATRPSLGCQRRPR